MRAQHPFGKLGRCSVGSEKGARHAIVRRAQIENKLRSDFRPESCRGEYAEIPSNPPSFHLGFIAFLAIGRQIAIVTICCRSGFHLRWRRAKGSNKAVLMLAAGADASWMRATTPFPTRRLALAGREAWIRSSSRFCATRSTRQWTIRMSWPCWKIRSAGDSYEHRGLHQVRAKNLCRGKRTYRTAWYGGEELGLVGVPEGERWACALRRSSARRRGDQTQYRLLIYT